MYLDNQYENKSLESLYSLNMEPWYQSYFSDETYVCHGDSLVLRCEQDLSIRIISVFYGREADDICNPAGSVRDGAECGGSEDPVLLQV